MDTRQIECFLHLADNLSFAKTAEEMYIAQSTLSREIQNLENEIGFKLFKRTSKYVILTEEGKQFKSAINPLANSLNTVISRIKNKKNSYGGTLRMGFFHVASLRKIPMAIDKFHKLYPDILPEIHQANLNQLNQMFHNDQLDLIFAVRSIMNPKENDNVLDIYKGDFVATLSKNHPLAHNQFLTFEMMNGFDILSLSQSSTSVCFEAFYHELALKCPDCHYIKCSSVDEQEVYLRSNIGIALSTEYSFNQTPLFVQIPIHEKATANLKTNYAVMWHKTSENHINDFIDILKEYANL